VFVVLLIFIISELDEIAQADGRPNYDHGESTFDVLRVAAYIQHGLVESKIDKILMYQEGKEVKMQPRRQPKSARAELDALVRKKKGEVMGEEDVSAREAKQPNNDDSEKEDNCGLRTVLVSLSKQVVSVFDSALSTVAGRAKVSGATNLGEIMDQNCIARQYEVRCSPRRWRSLLKTHF
jgi:hypothetical protein